MSPHFGQMSVRHFAKFNFSYKDLEEYFHRLSIILQYTSGQSKLNLCCVAHRINMHFKTGTLQSLIAGVP